MNTAPGKVSKIPPVAIDKLKQRVAIARALVSHPKLILADEPTAALDSKSGRDVVTLMQRLAKEQGCTILLVTHDNRIVNIVRWYFTGRYFSFCSELVLRIF